MAKTINIVNGTGTSNLINGNYSVTADVTGYDNTSINPTSINVEAGTNNYNFTISATGILTLHVTEDGTVSGTPIEGATFIRTDSEGNEYGAAITTDASGDAIFANVPYATSNAPLIYYKQTGSDGEHEFDASINSVSLSESSLTVEITNALGAVRTINLTDSNYDNLPITSGSLTLTL